MLLIGESCPSDELGINVGKPRKPKKASPNKTAAPKPSELKGPEPNEIAAPHPHELEAAKWTGVVGRWTRYTVIVSILTGAILVLQLLIQKRADDTSRITNRSYVVLQAISLTGLENGDWAVIPQWSNGGNITTGAMKTRINLIGSSDDPGVRSGFSRCNVSAGVSVPMILGPKQTSNISFFEAKASVFEGFQRATTKKIYVWGWARYADSLSEGGRTTRFCFDVTRVLGNPADPKGKLELLYNLCGESNCTDGQCEKEDTELPPPVCPNPPFVLD